MQRRYETQGSGILNAKLFPPLVKNVSNFIAWAPHLGSHLQAAEG
jgi:hypothetical protein